MPLKMPCPTCRKVVTYSEQHVGKKIRCPKCQSPIVLAGPMPAPAPAPRPAPAPAPRPAPGGRRPSPPAPVPMPAPAANPFDFNAPAPAANPFDFNSPAPDAGQGEDFGALAEARAAAGGSWAPIIKGMHGVANAATLLFLVASTVLGFQIVAAWTVWNGIVTVDSWSPLVIYDPPDKAVEYARYARWGGAGLFGLCGLWLFFALLRCRRGPGGWLSGVAAAFVWPALLLPAVLPWVLVFGVDRFEGNKEQFAKYEVYGCLAGGCAFGLLAAFFQALFLGRLTALGGGPRRQRGRPLLFFLFALVSTAAAFGVDIGAPEYLPRIGREEVQGYSLYSAATLTAVGLWFLGTAVCVIWYHRLTGKAVEGLRRSVRGY